MVIRVGPRQRAKICDVPDGSGTVGNYDIVASGCDQCVWVVGVVAGNGHWVEH